MTGPDPLDYGWWLASRSAGIVAILAVSVSVIIGLLMANGLPDGLGRAHQAQARRACTSPRRSPAWSRSPSTA